MRLFRVSAGEFLAGSPTNEVGRNADELEHLVALTKPFLIGAEEVTRGQFATFVRASDFRTDAEREGFAFVWNGRDFAKVHGATWQNAGYAQTDAEPVVNISWNDATAFCEWLSQKEHSRYRLPTEAEWEYSCRAGATTAYAWGTDPGGGAGKCNAADLTGKVEFPGWNSFPWADGFVYTAPAASFEPNRWGICDMHGNVLEWCSDWYGEYPARNAKPATNPTGPTAGSSRVLRGGSWGDEPAYCRAATRRQHAPDYRSFEIGFRVVLEPD